MRICAAVMPNAVAYPEFVFIRGVGGGWWVKIIVDAFYLKMIY